MARGPHAHPTRIKSLRDIRAKELPYQSLPKAAIRFDGHVAEVRAGEKREAREK